MSQRIDRTIAAPPTAVYDALVDPVALAAWRAPEGMRVEVHGFDARPGGRFRISLHYADPERAGKSGGHTDTYHGHFASLVPGEQVVEVIEFESDDPGLRGAMTVTTTLAATGSGTTVTVAFDGLPAAVDPAENEVGTRMALDKLAALVTASI